MCLMKSEVKLLFLKSFLKESFKQVSFPTSSRKDESFNYIFER